MQQHSQASVFCFCKRVCENGDFLYIQGPEVHSNIRYVFELTTLKTGNDIFPMSKSVPDCEPQRLSVSSNWLGVSKTPSLSETPGI